MSEENNLILLTDIIETRLRKQKELEYYEEELRKLQQKMFFIKKDIDITTLIINLIEDEKIMDLERMAYENIPILGEKKDETEG